MTACPTNYSLTKLIICQTHNIGDVVLTIPMIGVLKKYYPHCKIFLLGQKYTQAATNYCEHIDEFIDWDDLQMAGDQAIIKRFESIAPSAIIHLTSNKTLARCAQKANIPLRIGTAQRWYNWLYCNRLVNVARRMSVFHEAQIDLKLLRPLGLTHVYPLDKLVNFIQFTPTAAVSAEALQLLDDSRLNLIIHPGSKGHGREWPIEYFLNLINSLPAEKYNLFITGDPSELQRFSPFLQAIKRPVHNLMGKFTLAEYISFISKCDGLVASGTGPLHLAAAIGIHALGLFPPRKGISPRRWAPLGRKAEYLVHPRPPWKMCIGCRESVGCACMAQISVMSVKNVLQKWYEEKMAN